MSSLISLSIKGKDGEYKNYTISVQDETNEWGQNVAMWIEQTKEERERKDPRKYIGNGKVIWTDGNVKLAERKDQPQPTQTNQEDDLPF